MRKKLFIKGSFISNKILIAIIIFIVYSTFVLLNLTKEPSVGGDELSFANIAHSLDKNEFNKLPGIFSRHIAPSEKVLLIMYPPIYPWIIAITTHFFGFNIYTLRLTSFAIGLLLLFFFFLILRKIITNDILTMSVLLLFAVDQAFIRSSRYGRPDILTAFFITLSLLFYIKTLEEDNNKNYFLTGLFCGLSFMTHLALGLIPLMLTTLHFLLTKRFRRSGFKKLLFLIMPALIFFILWLIFVVLPLFLHNPGLFKNTVMVFKDKALRNKNYYANWIEFIKADISYIYLILLFPLILSLRNKNGIKSFLLLAYLFVYPYLLSIQSTWYAVWFTPIGCLVLLYLIREKNRYRQFFIVLVTIIISCGVVTQLRFAREQRGYSYENYSKRVSGYLPIGANVLILDIYPDPYIYLAAYRKDLKLEWDRKDAIKNADYVIAGSSLNDMMEGRDEDVSYALSHSQSYVPINEWEYVIFKMKKNQGGQE